MRITCTFHLDSAHRVPSVPKCSRLHGHTYEVELRLEGEPGPDGMILEFGAFKQRAWESVLVRYDHTYLNEVMREIPTVENLAKELHAGLVTTFPGLKLSIRVYEGHAKYAEVP